MKQKKYIFSFYGFEFFLFLTEAWKFVKQNDNIEELLRQTL